MSVGSNNNATWYSYKESTENHSSQPSLSFSEGVLTFSRQERITVKVGSLKMRITLFFAEAKFYLALKNTTVIKLPHLFFRSVHFSRRRIFFRNQPTTRVPRKYVGGLR